MTEYRKPEEQAATDEHNARVHAVLDDAAKSGGMLLAAMALDEPAEVVELWVNRFWNQLRDGLRDDRPSVAGLKIEDRLVAIELLLTPRMREEANEIVRGMRQGPS